MRKSWKSGPVTALVMAMLLLTAGALEAATLFVATTGSDANPGTAELPKLTVQAAIDRAAPGDTVQVLAGTYVGNIKMKTGVDVVGSGPYVSIIRGLKDSSTPPGYAAYCNSCHVPHNALPGAPSDPDQYFRDNDWGGAVNVNNVQNATLANFTIECDKAPGNHAWNRAVVIRGTTGSSFVLRNNVLDIYTIDTAGMDEGNGIWTYSPSSPTVLNNTLKGDGRAPGKGIRWEDNGGEVRNNIILGFDSGVYAPGVFNSNDCGNAFFQFNHNGLSSCTVEYASPAGSAGFLCPEGAIGTGNISASFNFSADMSLLAGSRGIDEGDPQPMYNDPDATRNDLGAYGGNYSDSDKDGIWAAIDHCPGDHNPDQADADGDGKGDVCDPCPFYADDEFNHCPGWDGASPPAGQGTVVLSGTTATACVQWQSLPGGTSVDAFLPDCSNVRFQLADASSGATLEPNCLVPPAYDLASTAPVSQGDSFCISCDLSPRFPGLTGASAVIQSASYSSYVSDPWYDRSSGTCLDSLYDIPNPQPDLPCKNPWIGQIDLRVSKKSPTISWLTPAPIIYGTPLGATQLNAAASSDGNAVLGTFSYQPPAASVLSPGSHKLKAVFTPADPASFGMMTAEVTLSVSAAFSGLLPPYAPPEQKAFKVKSTIPIKWQYVGENGPVPSANVNPRVSYRGPYSAGSSNVPTEVELAAEGSADYQYDPVTYTWQYNWKTTGLAKDKLYNIYVHTGATESQAFPILLK